MKTSISPPPLPSGSFVAALSRRSRIVDAGRGATVSAGMSFTPSLLQRSGLKAASRRMRNATAHGETRDNARLTMRISLTRRAGLRLQVCALIEPRDTREQIIYLGLGGRGNV